MLADKIAKSINDDFITEWHLLIKMIHKNHNFYDNVYRFIKESIMFHDIVQAVQREKFSEALKLLSYFQDPADILSIYRVAEQKRLLTLIAFLYLRFYDILDNHLEENEQIAVAALVYKYHSANPVQAVEKPVKLKWTPEDCQQKIFSLLILAIDEAIQNYENHSAKKMNKLFGFIGNAFDTSSETKSLVELKKIIINYKQKECAAMDVIQIFQNHMQTLFQNNKADSFSDNLKKIVFSPDYLLLHDYFDFSQLKPTSSLQSQLAEQIKAMINNSKLNEMLKKNLIVFT